VLNRSIIFRRSCWKLCLNVLNWILLLRSLRGIYRWVWRCWCPIRIRRKISRILILRGEVLRLKLSIGKLAIIIGGMLKNYKTGTTLSRICLKLISKPVPSLNSAKRMTHSGIPHNMSSSAGHSSQPKPYLTYSTTSQPYPSSASKTTAAS
jgi:hypothetical protein